MGLESEKEKSVKANEEVIEDIGFANAIREGRKNDLVF